MRDRRFPASVLLAAVAAVAAPVLLDAQAIQRSVFVSALDRNGVPVLDLGPSDIVVREDDVTREVLRVVPADEPMQILVLVDDSQAAEPYVRDYRFALPAFITALTERTEPGTRNEIALIGVAERPTIITDYTMDREQLLKGVQRIFSRPDSGAHLLDAIIEVSVGLLRRRALRPVIVAIVTEGPELSNRHYDQALEPLRASGAAFHAIVLGRPFSLEHDRAVVLDQGTRDTGGSYSTLLIGTALAGRLKELAGELTAQYRVTYARPQTLIPPERVTVASARPGVVVRGTAAVEERGRGRP